MKRLLALAGLLGFLAGAAAPASADEYSYHRTVDAAVPAAGARVLHIGALSGNIAVYADGGSTVRIHAVLKARSAASLAALAVRSARSGGTVNVQDVCPSTRSFLFWKFSDCDIELEIHYPRGLALDLHSENGNIRIQDPGGPVTLANANGNLTIENAASDLAATNRNGNVRARLANGWHGSAVTLSTHAGNVHLQVPSGFRSRFTAHTTFGQVENDAGLSGGPASVTATTTFGDVTISRG